MSQQQKTLIYKQIRIRKCMIGIPLALQLHPSILQYIYLKQFKGPKSIEINVHLVQRRAIVCYPTPHNILTNTILILSTALAQRWSNTIWRTPTCIRHPDICCQWWPNMCMLPGKIYRCNTIKIPAISNTARAEQRPFTGSGEVFI